MHLSKDMIIVKDILSADQKGDGFTKPLVYEKFLWFRRIICSW